MLWLLLPLFKLYKKVICGFWSQSINHGVGVGVLSGRGHRVLSRGAKKILDLRMTYICVWSFCENSYTHFLCTFCVCFMCMRAQLLNHVWLFATLWMVAHQAPLSMEFPRQEHWSGLLCRPSEGLPDRGTKPTPLTSLHRQVAESSPISHLGSPSSLQWVDVRNCGFIFSCYSNSYQFNS